MAWTWSELKSVSDEELVAQFDRNAQHTAMGTSFYTTEIHARAESRRGQRIEAMTHQMLQLTRAITGLTIVSAMSAVVATIAALRN